MFTNLNVESGTSSLPDADRDGDLPVSDVVRDDVEQDAVRLDRLRRPPRRQRRHRRLARDGGHAALRGDAPRDRSRPLACPTCVGVTKCQRVLYAATHSQGIWELKLPGK